MQVVVGRILRPHGLRGEVIVDVRTDDPDERFAPGSVLGTLTVVQARPHAAAGPGRLIVEFEGVPDRSAADLLRGTELTAESILPSDDPDVFSDHDLVGLAVLGCDGVVFGEVIRVDHPPANDLLVVRRPDGGTALVPFVKAIVPQVDVPGGRIVVTPPPGLFEL